MKSGRARGRRGEGKQLAGPQVGHGQRKQRIELAVQDVAERADEAEVAVTDQVVLRSDDVDKDALFLRVPVFVLESECGHWAR